MGEPRRDAPFRGAGSVTTTEPRHRPLITGGGPGRWGGPDAVTLTPRSEQPPPRPIGTHRRAHPPGPASTAGTRATAGTVAPAPTRTDSGPVPTVPLGGAPDRGAVSTPGEARRRRTRPARRVLLMGLWLGSLLVVLTTATIAPPPRPPDAPALAPRPFGAPAPSPGRRDDDSTPSPATVIGALVGPASIGHVSVAALDLATGRSFAYESDTHIDTASVVKLDLLETLLLHAQDTGRPLTPTTAQSATQMIENSDNDATTRLWDVVGGAQAITAANVRLGVHCTDPDDAQWGTSTTCARDQIELLAALMRPGPLGSPARSYAIGLLTHVEDDQRWGISAAADPGAPTALKNGWLPVDDDDGYWIVNSVGVTTVAHQPVVLAVLTEHQPSEEAGIDLVQALARTAAQAVVSGSPPSGDADPLPEHAQAAVVVRSRPDRITG